MNGIDKFVREAMPIQEAEKASGKNAATARPILKPSSTSGWDFTPIEQRQWIDIETQESNDLYCFQVLKFITRLLRHSQEVHRKADGAVHYDQVIDERKKKVIRQYRILVRRDEEALRQCSAMVDSKMGISSGKRWRTEEKV